MNQSDWEKHATCRYEEKFAVPEAAKLVVLHWQIEY